MQNGSVMYTKSLILLLRPIFVLSAFLRTVLVAWFLHLIKEWFRVLKEHNR